MRRGPLYLAAAVAVLAVLGIALHAWSRNDPDPPPPPEVVCLSGAYRGVNGRLITLTPSHDGLRYRLESGESGRLTRQPDGRWTATRGWADDGPPAAVARIGGCDESGIEFGLAGETLVPATREAFRRRRSPRTRARCGRAWSTAATARTCSRRQRRSLTRRVA